MPLSLPTLDRLQDCYDAVTPEYVQSLESEFGFVFPPDYRQFLLAYNAGYVEHPVMFRVRNPNRYIDKRPFDRSLGIVRDEESSEMDIRGVYKCFEDWIPSNLIPIASSASDPICMGMADATRGKIYLWDAARGDEDDGAVYLVADSFTEFLSRLYPEDDEDSFCEELPVFQAAERGQDSAVRAYLVDGGKVDCRNQQGQTLLMCAARASWPKIVRLLLEHGAAPNTVDLHGYSPLYHAAMHESNDGVKLLLAAGADARFCDDRGHTLVKLTWEKAFYRVSKTLDAHLNRSQ